MPCFVRYNRQLDPLTQAVAARQRPKSLEILPIRLASVSIPPEIQYHIDGHQRLELGADASPADLTAVIAAVSRLLNPSGSAGQIEAPLPLE
ncbi:MAG TPA: hypothetical protein VE422_26530 [Terriglobia bacterium]|nr:hypothetical protein [Terriglobia bacterium]